MRASAVVLTVGLAVGMLAGGCAPSGQGDPCTPEAIPSGGFHSTEVYVETSSVQCRTRVCMVYRLTGNPECQIDRTTGMCPPTARCHRAANPMTVPPTAAADYCVADHLPGTVLIDANSPDRVFCTCRCSAGGNAALPLCQCTEGYRCIPDADPGGGYCVPNELARAAGVCGSDADCTGMPGARCDPSHHCR